MVTSQNRKRKTPTLTPYTTLFRSVLRRDADRELLDLLMSVGDLCHGQLEACRRRGRVDGDGPFRRSRVLEARTAVVGGDHVAIAGAEVSRRQRARALACRQRDLTVRATYRDGP